MFCAGLCEQEQSRVDESELQALRFQTETLLDTLKDIAQVMLLHVQPQAFYVYPFKFEKVEI